MQFVEASEFPPEDAARLSDGEIDPYGTDHLPITWEPKSHHLLLLADDRQLIAHAGFIPISVQAGTDRISGVGLGGVMVHRRNRGCGVGSLLIREVGNRMPAMEGRVGLLFCRDVLLAFYEQNGWRRVSTEVTVDQEQGTIVMPLSTCWLPLESGYVLPNEALRLYGLPF